MSTAELARIAKMWPSFSPAVCVPRTEGEYKNLVEVLDHITDEVGEDEKHPLSSLMDVIGVLIEKYEDEHVPALRQAPKRFEYAPPKKSGKVVVQDKSTAYGQSRRPKKLSKIFP